MNKIIITMICIIVVIGAMFTAVIIFKPNENEKPETIVTEVADEEILDECTEEYEEMEKQNMIEANSAEEKISPNCSFTEKIYYKKCGHTTSQYLELPQDLVNETEEQLQEKYLDWEIQTFTSNEIILYQEKDEECGEHYLVKDKDGTVTIYQILEDGTEKEYETTGITTEYLTETDKINMKNGIKVNGKQELNQLIEDFE